MAQLGVQPCHVVERVLNHSSGTFAGVAGVYNRFAYFDEMRAALELWEQQILRLAQPVMEPASAGAGSQVGRVPRAR